MVGGAALLARLRLTLFCCTLLLVVGGSMLMRTKWASVKRKYGHPRMSSYFIFALASYFERGTFGRGSERVALPLVVACRG